ncbi:alpha/beta fold hydrolase [Lysobacter silvisoli]|uniref:Alpha/beta hydrolase n=1 Tax=Lysobacter silvisoli TaxID=2293254 RepID=A0A371JYY9_9GAMM|nr:alpha/beta hydrolase [Lysobacter silvisoli]RDZ26820.1 alpha/beta hydrolase [Lysobacter silvisoli]
MREFVVDTAFGRICGLRNHVPGAPRLLALHGWLDNGASFVPLAPHLAGFDLVAPDLPGHGASAHLPMAAEYTLVAATRAAFAVADALGWERFSLLGHSMGGAVASTMAAAVPQRVERLLLIEALGGLSETEDRTAARLRGAFANLSQLSSKQLRVFPDLATAVRTRMMVNGLSEPVARLLVERGLAPVPAGRAAEGMAGGYVWRSDPRLTMATSVRMTEGQVRDLIASIACPVRVIHAEPAFQYFGTELRTSRSALLRNGDSVGVQGSHHLHMEDPVSVAAAIGDFLTRPL